MRIRVRGSSGFTLIELAIVVAVVGGLGAVVIPHFVRESRKVHYEVEVTPIFAELFQRGPVQDRQRRPPRDRAVSRCA